MLSSEEGKKALQQFGFFLTEMILTHFQYLPIFKGKKKVECVLGCFPFLMFSLTREQFVAVQVMPTA